MKDRKIWVVIKKDRQLRQIGYLELNGNYNGIEEKVTGKDEQVRQMWKEIERNGVLELYGTEFYGTEEYADTSNTGITELVSGYDEDDFVDADDTDCRLQWLKIPKGSVFTTFYIGQLDYLENTGSLKHKESEVIVQGNLASIGTVGSGEKTESYVYKGCLDF